MSFNTLFYTSYIVGPNSVHGAAVRVEALAGQKRVQQGEKNVRLWRVASEGGERAVWFASVADSAGEWWACRAVLDE